MAIGGWRGRALLLGFPLAVMLLTMPSRGAPPARASWRLEWTDSAGARSCPSEREISGAIAGRLGYDPFRPDGERSVAAVLTTRGAGFAVELRFVDETGGGVTKRLESSATDCSVIAAATTLAVAIAIQEREGSAEDAGAESPPESAPPAAASAPAASARPHGDGGPSAPSPPEPPATLMAAGVVAIDLLPRAAVGVEVRGLARITRKIHLSGGLLYLPEVRRDERFDIGATLGRLGACYEAGRGGSRALYMCADARLGSALVIVHSLQPLEPGSRLMGGASLSALFVQRISLFSAFLGAELFTPIPRRAFNIAGTGERVFTFAPLSLFATVGVAVGGP